MSRLPPLSGIPADLVLAADYQRHAWQRLDENALAYLEGGAADELTCQANLQVWQEWALLPRMLRDLRGGHTRCRLLGQELQHPILLAPVAFETVRTRYTPLDEAFGKAHELKVIVGDEADFEWAERNAARVGAGCILYLQPEWSVAERMMPAIVEYAKAHPKWNISIQTHKYMHIP